MWNIRSIGNMHLTKDTMRGQISVANISKIIKNLATLNVTHLGIECPLDEASEYLNNKPVVGYVENWIKAIRAENKSVFFRGTWNNFEGIYDSPKRTPKSQNPLPLGKAEGVLNGSDKTSYLYKTYNFIQLHASFFKDGDVWGVMPEPENQGIGNNVNQMFASYDELGQWLVDLKIVSDAAFKIIGKNVITGMTAINGGTAIVNLNTSKYWSQLGRVCIDHYVTISQYDNDLDMINKNTGVDIYFGEIGTTQAVGNPQTDLDRANLIDKLFNIFVSKSYLKGINYFQSVGGNDTSPESIMDNKTYELLPRTSSMLADFYKEQTEEIPQPPVEDTEIVFEISGEIKLKVKKEGV